MPEIGYFTVFQDDDSDYWTFKQGDKWIGFSSTELTAYKAALSHANYEISELRRQLDELRTQAAQPDPDTAFNAIEPAHTS